MLHPEALRRLEVAEEWDEEVRPAPRRHRPPGVAISGVALRVGEEVEEGEELRGGERRHQCGNRSEAERNGGKGKRKKEKGKSGAGGEGSGNFAFCLLPFAFLEDFPQQHHSEQAPRENHQLRHTCEHLHRAGQRGEDEFAATRAPGLFGEQDDPRHPAEGDAVVRPGDARERRAVDGEGRAGDGGGEGVAGPAFRQGPRAEAAEPEVQQAEDAQRPRHRERDEEERAGVKTHGAPLREEGGAAV